MATDDPAPTVPTPLPGDDKQQVQAMVAACIEAMERGDADPVTRICAERPDLATRVHKKLAQLVLRGLIQGVAPPMPSSIGSFRIVRELGSGGMGTVYLAEQQEPVRRQVALKVIKLGMDTREVVARFGAERQTLAAMSHPHIAQVYEAGATDDGRPFFAMEYVSGEPITAFCDRRQLPLRARLQLFATVCRAVQHANDRGVIHRDLKPSNILVAEHDGQFVPKVIDFGVAKATGPVGAQYGLQTRVDQVLGTPEYMSPEHAGSGGLDVDIRSDVYSLGVVLYELLCGELPFASQRLRAASRRELERILAEEPPPSPGTRLQAAADPVLTARGFAGGRRQRGLRELDWITGMALAKLRQERYGSAAALADDVERWLRHEPVVAAPPTLRYRLHKFVRRHRLPVAAAVLVFGSLVAGLVVSLDATAAARLAQQQESAALADMRSFYDLARDAVARMVDVADRDLDAVPRASAIRRTMLDDAMKFYAALVQRRPADPALRVDIAWAQDRVGRLQERLGQHLEAVQTLRACAQAVDGLLREYPGEMRLLRLNAMVHTHLGQALTQRVESAPAVAAFEAALAALATLRALGTEDPAWLADNEAAVLLNLAVEAVDQPDAAIAYLDRAVGHWQQVLAADPKAARALAGSARGLALRAKARSRQGDLDRAAGDLQQAVAMLGQAGDGGDDLRQQSAATESQLADVLRRLRRGEEAAAAQARSIALSEQLEREFPGVPEHQAGQAAGHWFLAELALDRGDRTTAHHHLDRAIGLRQALATAYPDTPRYAMMCVRALQTKARVQAEEWQNLGADVAPALATLATAIAMVDALRTRFPDEPDVALTQAAVHETRGAIADGRGDHAAAMVDHRAAYDTLAALVARVPQSVEARCHLASVCSNLVTAHWYRQDFAAGAAAGDEGIAHARAGLAIDATHDGLLTLVPTLVSRTAIARRASGDADGALRTQLLLVEVPEFGADAHEVGAINLGELARGADDEPGQAELLDRAEQELRACLQRRAERRIGAPTDGSGDGLSLHGTQLRDLDLRIILIDVLEELEDWEAVDQVTAEAMAQVQAMPKLTAARTRTVYERAAQAAYRAGDLPRAAGLAEEMLTRIGPDGGGCYLAAVLFARIAHFTDDATLKDTSGRRAVECLRLALDKREVDRRALGHVNFAALRVRADYLELLEK